MHLQLNQAEIRSWRESDADSIWPLANNKKVWRNLRDGVPHPYTRADAVSWIAAARARKPETVFAIAVEGQAVGGIGFHPKEDVERLSAELGYWLGEPYWGRGITTEAVIAVTRYAIEQHGLVRIFALPYAWNPASARVLEKAGYVLEGRLRRAVIKDGEIIDQLLYAWVVPE